LGEVGEKPSKDGRKGGVTNILRKKRVKSKGGTNASGRKWSAGQFRWRVVEV